MESYGRLKQGEKEGAKSKNNGGRKSKSQGGRKSKSKPQDRSKARKCVGGEEQSEETRAESTDESEVTGRFAEVRTGG